MTKKRIGPRVEKASAEYLTQIFRSLNAGAEYAIASFASLYRKTLAEIRGTFNESELKLMIDVFNATWLTPGLAGQHLELSVRDGIDLDGLDEKWNIDGDALVEKIHGLTIYQAAAIEIWANGFWQAQSSTPSKRDAIIDEYIRTLL